MPATASDRLNGLTTSVAVKAPVAAVSDANLTLSGLQTVGGVALAENDRVLVKDQTDSSENGVYLASTSDWVRAKDFDGARDVVKGTLVVYSGDSSIYYRVTSSNPIFVGTSDIDFEAVGTAITVDSVSTLLNPRTAAEISAAVTPADKTYPAGHRSRYSTLADAVAVCDVHPLYIYDDETITAAVTIPDKGRIFGVGRPQITNSTAGAHVFDATSKSGILIDGVRFKGADSTTVPSSGFGGFAAANNGLVTLTTCTDVRIVGCEFDTFYNTCTVQNCDRIWIQNNRCRNFRLHGILVSTSTRFHVNFNDIADCTQTGGVIGYGIQATGDENGGNTSDRCSISHNVISGIPSWDGIMSHDVDGLDIIGNDIRDVRMGLDIGHLLTTNFVRNVRIIGNYIKSTTTDTWSGSGAQHAGIYLGGKDATHRVLGATISSNIIDGFFAISGLTLAGTSNNISVAHADDVTVTGNVIKNVGSQQNSAGIDITGTVNRISVTGNTFQGTMPKGGVRFESATCDLATVSGNTISQDTTSDLAIYLTASTLSLALANNATNSTAYFTQSTSTITFVGEYLVGSATYDPSSLADGAGTTTTVTVTGAALGDFAEASFGGDIQGITVTAWVSASNTVSVRFQNESGGVIDLGSSTLRARVRKKLT